MPPPEVHHAFDSSLSKTLDSAQGAQVAQEIHGELTDIRLRQSRWLRKHKAAGKVDWRPRKRHRVSAWRWLRAIDHQCCLAMGTGLQHFKQAESLSERGPWDTWPCLSIALDCGTDGLAAISAATRKLNMNLDFTPDQSHLCWRGIIAALKACKLWVFMLTSMLAGNTAHGPWNDDLRYQQTKEAMDTLMAHEAPECSPLFMALVQDMAFDLQETMEFDMQDLPKQLWDHLKEAKPWLRKGTKSNLNRFLSAILQGSREAHLFSLRAFIYTYCVLELDMVHTPKFRKAFVKEPTMEAGQAPTRMTDPAEKALRGACQNQMVVAAMFYSDNCNKYTVRMIVRVCRPIMLWYEQQSAELRSASASRVWMLRQMQGEFMTNCFQVHTTLTSEADMQWIGFIIPKLKHSQFTLNEIEMSQQEDLATSMGRLSMQLIGCRLRRELWMLAGWPAKALLLLDAARADDVLASFRQASADFQVLKTLQDDTAGVKKVLHRSVFHHVSVQQLCLMLEESEFTVTPKVARFIQDRFSRIICSQIDEDAFQRQKNWKKQGFATLYSRPEKSFAIPIVKKVLSDVHGYQEIAQLSEPIPADLQLPRDAFEAKGQSDAFLMKDIVNCKPTPEWYSPSAENLGVQHADLALIRQTLEQDKACMMPNAWLGCLANASHDFVLRLAGQHPGPWYAGLTHLSDSACLVWPMLERGVPGTSFTMFTAAPSQAEPVMITIFDLDLWEARAYKWRSPAWQWNMFAASSSSESMPTGVRAVADGLTMPLLRLCAEQAFFSLPKSTLDHLANHIGAEPQKAGDMFASLMSLLKHVLNDFSHEQHLKIAERRLGNMSHEMSACVEELLELDEGMQMLEPEDEQELRREMQQRDNREIVIKGFAQALQEERRKKLPSKATAQSTAKAGGYKGLKELPTGTIDQKDARKLVPPGGYIWRSNTDGRWQGHFPPMPRTSYSWAVHGHRGAAVRVLQDLWGSWCTLHGFDTTDAPVAGLWGALDEGSGGAAASSSQP